MGVGRGLVGEFHPDFPPVFTRFAHQFSWMGVAVNGLWALSVDERWQGNFPIAHMVALGSLGVGVFSVCGRGECTSA